MASTVGKEIVDRIVDEINNNNASFGVVLDAVASETADAALDWMVDFINKMIRREGKKLTKMRYSPGYGDLPLSNQKLIYDVLNLERLESALLKGLCLCPKNRSLL